MLFKFDKLYCDIITPEGDVGIGYITSSRLGFLNRPACSFEWYPVGGERKVYQAVKMKPPFPLSDQGDFSILMDLDQGESSLRLRYKSAEDPFDPETRKSQGLTDHLVWTIRTPRAKALLDLKGPGGDYKFTGEGYADRMVMTTLPRKVPLKKLQWGRLHFNDGHTVVFTDVVFENGQTWQSYLRINQKKDQRLNGDNFLLTETPGGASRILQLPGNEGRYELKTIRILHNGPALDKERVPSSLERSLSRMLSGDIQETRFYSQILSTRGRARKLGFALHEYVTFSPSGARKSDT